MSVIRSATAADAAGICAILNPIIADTTITFSPNPVTGADVALAIATHVARSAPYLVLEHDRQVQGYAKYGPFRDGEGYARTAEITVHLSPSARGHGWGRKLVVALEDHARSHGLRSLIAGISAENRTALEFHAKLGFAHVGTIPEAGHKFGRYIDLVLMQKSV
ncbi:GNAT family N-acetyltransferase [Litoreibacter albidus]|uniref:Phosphinothricin acetyltransferase n=1 Tax=Litoreibacter albidus TaxID=670155 RepID=A0A1H3B2W9_9RHOB|nr:GNAT family N-acetyltransferase [Litoreibacter albidus]SDX36273.1 phosphinothricin acetyltransferase [Litoreibacter albidus]